jgi:hypothetical protein
MVHRVASLLQESTWRQDGIPKRGLFERRDRTGISEALRAYEAVARGGLHRIIADKGRSLQAVADALHTCRTRYRGNAALSAYIARMEAAVIIDRDAVNTAIDHLTVQAILNDVGLRDLFHKSSHENNYLKFLESYGKSSPAQLYDLFIRKNADYDLGLSDVVRHKLGAAKSHVEYNTVHAEAVNSVGTNLLPSFKAESRLNVHRG